jgi:hypothetical protein
MARLRSGCVTKWVSAGDFCVDAFALGLLWQRLGKVIIAQVKLTFQVVPDAGQADASAHRVEDDIVRQFTQVGLALHFCG